jgi:hypothetical protein
VSDDEQYMEARFILDKGNGESWSEDEVDGFLDEFFDFIEDRGIYAGGYFGPMIPEERECTYCDGSGTNDYINDEDRCETCGGSGRKDEEEPTSSPEATEAWRDVYGSIEQENNVLSIEHGQEQATENDTRRSDPEGNGSE